MQFSSRLKKNPFDFTCVQELATLQSGTQEMENIANNDFFNFSLIF